MKPICFILFAFFLVTTSASATTIYRGVDENGRPMFSDQPINNGQEIKLPPSATYSAPPTTASPPQTQATSYVIHILHPENDQTITVDLTTVEVKLSVTPQLEKEDKIQLVLNGAATDHLYDSLTIPIENLDRGAYQLQAKIVSAKDPTHVKAESEMITFYQKRAIDRALFPVPTANPAATIPPASTTPSSTGGKN